LSVTEINLLSSNMTHC